MNEERKDSVVDRENHKKRALLSTSFACVRCVRHVSACESGVGVGDIFDNQTAPPYLHFLSSSQFQTGQLANGSFGNLDSIGFRSPSVIASKRCENSFSFVFLFLFKLQIGNWQEDLFLTSF